MLIVSCSTTTRASPFAFAWNNLREKRRAKRSQMSAAPPEKQSAGQADTVIVGEDQMRAAAKG